MAKRHTIKVLSEQPIKPWRDSRKIVQELYQINELLVATAPITEVMYDDKFFNATIHYAEYKGIWAWGVSWAYKGSGVGCGGGGFYPSWSGRQKYPVSRLTKDAVRITAIKDLIESFTRRGDHPYNRSVKPVIDALNKALNPQLSLF